MDKVQELRNEIAALKKYVDRRINLLEEEIKSISTSSEQLVKADNAKVEIRVEAKKEEKVSLIPSVDQIAAATKVETKSTTEPKVAPSIPLVKKQYQHKPNAAEKLVHAFVKYLLEDLLAGLMHPIKAVYAKYKSENKLPVFFMTIGGVVAILFGCGFLLQYVYAHYFMGLSEIIRTSSGFLLSAVIGGLGAFLHRKKKAYQEFGSVLVALALVINYLICYFLSSVLVQESFVFVLIGVNTVLAILCSYLLETRVIAVLTLLGGAFCPFFTEAEMNLLAYFSYLWLLSCGLIWLSEKIKWQALLYLVIACGVVILEGHFLILGRNTHVWQGVAFIHAFSYLYLGAIVWRSIKETSLSLSTTNVKWLLSVFVAHVVCLFQAFEYDYSSQALSIVYLLNAVIFLVLSAVSKTKIEKKYWVLLLSITASFVSLSGIVFLEGTFINVFLAIEAILLLYVGLVYRSPLLRKEAAVVAIASLVQSVYALLNTFSHGNQQIGVLSLGLVCLAYLCSVAIYYMYARRGLHGKRILLFDRLFLLGYQDVSNVLLSVFVVLFLSSFGLETWGGVALFATSLVLVQINKVPYVRFGYLWSKIVMWCSLFYATFMLLQAMVVESNWLFSMGVDSFVLLSLLAAYAWFKSLGKSIGYVFVHRAIVVVNAVTIIALFLSYYFDAFVFCVLPLVAIPTLVFGVRTRDLFIKSFAFLLFASLPTALVFSYFETGLLHFSGMTVYGKMAIAETGLFLFFLTNLNLKVLRESKFVKPFDYLRLVFYWVIPLAVTSSVNRHFPDLMSYALCLSCLIPYVLHKLTARQSLVIEYYILTCFAITNALYQLEAGVFLFEIGVLSTVFVLEKGYTKEFALSAKWGANHKVLSFFLGGSLMLGAGLVFEDLSMLYIGSLYMFMLVLFRKFIYALRNIPSYYYVLGVLFLSLGLLINVTFLSTRFADSIPAVSLLMLSLVALGRVLYLREVLFILPKFLKQWKINFSIFHVLCFLAYCVLIDQLFVEAFQTMLTLGLVLYGVVLLFHGLKVKFDFVKVVYLPFFVFALAKLFFFDLKDFSSIQKVLVLIVSGVLLLGGAYLFIRIKERYKERGV